MTPIGPDHTSGWLPSQTGRVVTGLGVLGFGFLAGPVYRNPIGETVSGQPTTWAGIGGLALLLAGLLAVPVGRRATVAVLSAWGLLLAGMAMVAPPEGFTVGWALIAILVLAVLQTVLATLLALEPAPLDVLSTERRTAPVPAENVDRPDMPWATAEAAVQSADAAHPGAQTAGARPNVDQFEPAYPGDVPAEFTPPASPAGGGAQPARHSAGPGVHGVWGHNPRPISAAGQPVRSEPPI